MGSKRVAIVKVSDNLEESVARVLSLLGGMEKVVSKGDMVVIKPNVLAAKTADTGATTSPELVGILARKCYESGARKVVVAESANWGVETLDTFRACGYFEMAEKEGVELTDLKKGEFREFDIKGYVLNKVRVPKLLLDADKVINVPVLKTHSMTKITLSLKNISVGISSDDDKQACLHQIGLFHPISPEIAEEGSFLDHSMVDINTVVPTHFIVVDGLVGLQGLGAPLLGEPVGSNLLIAGFNRVSVDSVGTRIMGYDPSEINHIRLASKIGLGEMNMDRIEVIGEKIDDSILDFKKSFLPDIEDIGDRVKVICGGKCRTCHSTLNYSLIRHGKELAQLDVPVTIYVGPQDKVKKPEKEKRMHVFYGNCAGKGFYGGGFVAGCPPRSRRQFFQAIGRLDLYNEDEGLDSNR